MRARIAALLIGLAAAAAAFAQPYSVTVKREPQSPQPGQLMTMDAGALIKTGVVLPALRMKIEVPVQIGEYSLDQGAWICSRSGRAVDCEIGPASGAVPPVRITFTIPSAGRYLYRVELSAFDQPTVVFNGQFEVERMFRVTTSADASAGSLRQTLLEAQAECTDADCRVVFEEAAMRIALESPLPAITARKRFFLDGRGAMLDGRRVEGPGLDVRAESTVEIKDLTIESFGGDGLFILSTRLSSLRLENVTITGNRYRGVSMHAPRSWLNVSKSAITDNGYSGLALWSSDDVALVNGTTIARNGASGVFLWNVEMFSSLATITENAQFGISLVPGATPGGSLVPGRITNNGIRNVDWALDGESPRDAEERDGIPNAPELIEARYDAATGETTVRGRIRTVLRGNAPQLRVVFMTGELQPDGTAVSDDAEWITIFMEDEDTIERLPIDKELSFRLKKAKPGQYIGAYAHYWERFSSNVFGSSSEVSAAVRVE